MERQLEPACTAHRAGRSHRGVRHRLLSIAIAALCAVFSVGFLSCNGSRGQAPENTGAPEAEGSQPSVHSYTLRGMVRQVPDPQDPAKQLLIHHEPIVDWVNEEGFETGMSSMTMPFTPAPQVDLSGIEPGDTVRFTFRVDWENAPRMQLTAIEPAEFSTQ